MFYDGVASRQASAAADIPAVQVGTWTGAASQEWREFTVDLTKSVSRIGQYEIAFAPPAGAAKSGLEFRGPEVAMYGGTVPDGVEAMTAGGTFRITRSQQTLDEFPTIFQVKIRGGAPGTSGPVTIRPITY